MNAIVDFLNVDLIQKEKVLLEQQKAPGTTAEELKKKTYKNKNEI